MSDYPKSKMCLIIAAGVFFTTAAAAQYSGAIAPILGKRNYGFFDPKYAKEEGVQHLGVDISAAENAEVRSPVDGTVVTNNTWASDINQAYLVIRGPDGEYVLGHIASTLAAGAVVKKKQVVGKVRPWPGNSHVHFGLNRKGVSQAIVGKWGWGRAPLKSSIEDALAKGWVKF